MTPYQYENIANALHSRRQQHRAVCCLSFHDVGDCLTGLIQVMFPHFDQSPDQQSADYLANKLAFIHDCITGAIKAMQNAGKAPELASSDIDALVYDFMGKLPAIADACTKDAIALHDNDPAAQSLDEVIISYPGFYAMAVYRLAHELYNKNIPILPRLMAEYAHTRTGIDIHPGATIGHSCFIDHGTGVVIGGTAVLGDNVKIYQGVTIGALRVDTKDKHVKRHPTIEDDVIIYANATILGGDTVIGQGSIIGGSVWLTRSIPPQSRVMFKACDTEVITPNRV